MTLGTIGQLVILLPWLVAQAAQEAAPAVLPAAPDGEAAAADVNPFLQFFANPINLILISAILFMFIVVRPQQKQMKQQQRALAELKKNDRIITASGIHGTVVQVGSGEPVVTIRIDDNSGARMTINRESISKIVNSETKE